MAAAFENFRLSAAIQSTLSMWFQELRTCGACPVLMRGSDSLPSHAGFDLDVMVAEDKLEVVLRKAMAIGRRQGLLAPSIRKTHSGKVLWIDLPAGGRTRGWLLLDVQTQFPAGFDTMITAIDVSTVWEQGSGGWLQPVPDEEWRCLIDLAHMLRKRRLRSFDKAVLTRSACNPQAAGGLLQRYFTEVPAHRLAKIFSGTKAAGAKRETIEALSRKAGLASRRNGAAYATGGWRSRLSRFIFFRLFFAHWHNPAFIAITGPDGVGKSSFIGALNRRLSAFPIAVDHFHHLSDTKGEGWSGTAAPLRAVERHLSYRFVRALWRGVLPQALRNTVVVVIGELRYALRVNALIGNSHFSGRVCIADRYCYDRYIKLTLEGRSGMQRAMARLNCRLMRPPRLTVHLRDDPAHVHRRKPQLSVAEIDSYQSRLPAMCRRYGATLMEIDVAGRTPDELARDALELVLKALESDLINLVGNWEKTMRPDGIGKILHD